VFATSFVLSNSVTVDIATAALFLLGMRVIYRSIVEPFTPMYGGDPIQKWKDAHMTEPPSP
jgi:hypothetical protein